MTHSRTDLSYLSEGPSMLPDMASTKLYTSPDMPGLLIAEDGNGSLVAWPAAARGWTKRTPYRGRKNTLVEADSAIGRRTGWPGSSRGPLPRSGGEASKPFTLRITDDERAAWTSLAGDQPLSDWIREQCNAARHRASKRRAR